ncbi:hypothetical protein [Pseudogemmobacter bohemicus]|nr:hypothetical protein [Pseudogemmobacter bohemicus]
MSSTLKLLLPLVRKMLIPALTAFGGFLVGVYPSEITALCSRVV